MAKNSDITEGTGTLWSTYGILPGHTFGSDGYQRARIHTVNSDTLITL